MAPCRPDNVDVEFHAGRTKILRPKQFQKVFGRVEVIKRPILTVGGTNSLAIASPIEPRQFRFDAAP
jgi:hypothetical protein